LVAEYITRNLKSICTHQKYRVSRIDFQDSGMATKK
jgi:hypothetical protein